MVKASNTKAEGFKSSDGLKNSKLKSDATKSYLNIEEIIENESVAFDFIKDLGLVVELGTLDNLIEATPWEDSTKTNLQGSPLLAAIQGLNEIAFYPSSRKPLFNRFPISLSIDFNTTVISNLSLITLKQGQTGGGFRNPLVPFTAVGSWQFEETYVGFEFLKSFNERQSLQKLILKVR